MRLRERQRSARQAVSSGLGELEEDYWLLSQHGHIDDDRIDLGELTDLPGVGPGTAKKLRGAGITSPVDLQGKSQEEISAIDGIGPTTAARIRSVVDQPAPNVIRDPGNDPRTERSKSHIHRRSSWVGISDAPTIIRDEPRDDDLAPHASTVEVRGQDKDDALADHADRTPESRRADESYNAPITLSYEQWAQNKDRYDYPGVDTISKTRKVGRVRGKLQRAIEKGAVRDFEVSSDALKGENYRDTKGTFKERSRRIGVKTKHHDTEDTLAHEVGHAADAYLGRPSERVFDDEQVRAEAKEVIQTRVGGRMDEDGYALGKENELWANFFAAATLEPRATRRDAPTAYRAIENELVRDFGRF